MRRGGSDAPALASLHEYGPIRQCRPTDEGDIEDNLDQPAGVAHDGAFAAQRDGAAIADGDDAVAKLEGLPSKPRDRMTRLEDRFPRDTTDDRLLHARSRPASHHLGCDLLKSRDRGAVECLRVDGHLFEVSYPFVLDPLLCGRNPGCRIDREKVPGLGEVLARTTRKPIDDLGKRVLARQVNTDGRMGVRRALTLYSAMSWAARSEYSQPFSVRRV